MSTELEVLVGDGSAFGLDAAEASDVAASFVVRAVRCAGLAISKTESLVGEIFMKRPLVRVSIPNDAEVPHHCMAQVLPKLAAFPLVVCDGRLHSLVKSQRFGACDSCFELLSEHCRKVLRGAIC